MPLLVTKPKRSIAKRTFRIAAARQKKRAGFFARRMAQRKVREWLSNRLSEVAKIVEKKKRRGESTEIPDVNLHGVKLWPPTEADIMALQEGMVPERLAYLAKKMDARQYQRLIQLLWKYYTEGMQAKSAEWNELKHILTTSSKAATTAKRSLRTKTSGFRRPDNIVHIARHSRDRYRYRKTG